ncbi:hypothetical protein DNTS_009264 [Danionella cerebrum]|uniref:Uncharacterized protein n=1 Tax=Danionella cerebrum TaxID=2873325 RepID=A0A553Q5L0_9TELE|nr:hypothetical protein DNTS_009264 [Danionella translucida]
MDSSSDEASDVHYMTFMDQNISLAG